jgi:urease accessory protein
MDIIRAPLASAAGGASQILLPVDRLTLAKRRWHAAAEDGREFGFDLAEPLADGVAFFSTAGATYLIAQRAEPVLEIPLAAPAESARLGWLVGNLHFALEISGTALRVADDPALRQMFAREHIHFLEKSSVFHPFRSGHVH